MCPASVHKCRKRMECRLCYDRKYPLFFYLPVLEHIIHHLFLLNITKCLMGWGVLKPRAGCPEETVSSSHFILYCNKSVSFYNILIATELRSSAFTTTEARRDRTPAAKNTDCCCTISSTCSPSKKGIQ